MFLGHRNRTKSLGARAILLWMAMSLGLRADGKRAAAAEPLPSDRRQATLASIEAWLDREVLPLPLAATDRDSPGQATGYTQLMRDLVTQRWLLVEINPESRVKLKARELQAPLAVDRPYRGLVEIRNESGITAPLVIEAIDLAERPAKPPAWFEIRWTESGQTAAAPLTGRTLEWKVVEIVCHRAGRSEVRLQANAGQGTQDLGFRAVADIQLETNP